jgi:alpha-beta hydrolase superfamily lysophospholipase
MEELCMRKNELFFPSADKQTNIHMVMWEPDEEVLGVLQIVHGITEHIMKYEEMAMYYTERGIAVVGIDLLGHGLSTNNGNKVMYFGGIGSWKYAVEDINRCFVHAKEMYSDVPYTMLGFSLGSFLVRTQLIDYPGLVDASILVGTGQVSNLGITLAQSVIKSETRKYGDNVATEKVRDLTFGIYNKKFKPNRTDYDWLCSDDKALDLYIADPLRGQNVTIGLFREMLSGMKYTANKDNIRKMSKMKPLLLISGDNDAVGDFGKGLEKIYKSFKSCGVEDTTMKLYDGLRHAILHEANKEVIFEDIYSWMKARNLIKDKTIIEKKHTRGSLSKSISSSTIVKNDEVKSVIYGSDNNKKD